MIKIKISQLLFDQQMRASTAARADWDRSTSPSIVASTLQRPPSVQGGNLLSGSMNATQDFRLHSDSSNAGVFRSSSPDLDNQARVFPPGHFFQHQPSFLQDLKQL